MQLAFVFGLAAALAVLFAWGFRTLPRARWQVLAVVPVARRDEHRWSGVNFTWYGLFVAGGIVCATGMAVVLFGALQVSLLRAALVSLPLLALGVWISGAISIAIEHRPSTYTVVGAVALTLLLAPWLLVASNRVAPQSAIPVLPALAVLAIAVTLGESVGRLGCISFGCCYGAPMSSFGVGVRRWLGRWSIAYDGPTKKAVYEGHHRGTPLLPVQALSSIACGAAALCGLSMFLRGDFGAAFVTPVALSMLWRVACECWRDDLRRRIGPFSAYQWLALSTLPSATVMAIVFRGQASGPVNLDAGLHAFWSPGVILLLQAIWAITFFHYGRSTVTAATLALHLAGQPLPINAPGATVTVEAGAATACLHPVS